MVKTTNNSKITRGYPTVSQEMPDGFASAAKTTSQIPSTGRLQGESEAKTRRSAPRRARTPARNPLGICEVSWLQYISIETWLGRKDLNVH